MAQGAGDLEEEEDKAFAMEIRRPFGVFFIGTMAAEITKSVMACIDFFHLYIIFNHSSGFREPGPAKHQLMQ
jgi:hypothetical protein